MRKVSSSPQIILLFIGWFFIVTLCIQSCWFKYIMGLVCHCTTSKSDMLSSIIMTSFAQLIRIMLILVKKNSLNYSYHFKHRMVSSGDMSGKVTFQYFKKNMVVCTLLIIHSTCQAASHFLSAFLHNWHPILLLWKKNSFHKYQVLPQPKNAERHANSYLPVRPCFTVGHHRAGYYAVVLTLTTK